MNKFLKYIIFGPFEAGFWGERHSRGVEKWIFRLWMYPVGESIRACGLGRGAALRRHWRLIHYGTRFDIPYRSKKQPPGWVATQ